MKKKTIKDIPLSLRSQLNKIAKESGRSFDAVALQYFQERFLYRLSRSKYKDKFILKGAVLLLVHYITRFRPTKDMDLHARGIKNDPENIVQIISEISGIESEDGLIFDTSGITIETIKEGADYEGMRAKIDVKLGTMIRKIQLDIAFGDIITPEAAYYSFPVLLDSPSPQILCYPFETIVAEKIESIVKLNFYTSRIKDFYDILFISGSKDFNLQVLKRAVSNTFQHRNTKMSDIHILFSDEFKRDNDKHDLWKAFLLKNSITLNMNFYDAMDQLEIFLNPIFDESNNFKMIWDIHEYCWK